MADKSIQKSGREYKDTLFRTLFGDAEHFLELYNAVADEHYPNNTIVTPCPSNSLLNRFNDIAACIDDQLIIFFEHQSTISKNMPLRLLSYATDILYLHAINRDDLYDSKQVTIPTPKFYVLYNGKQKLKQNELKLSDAFRVKSSEPALELATKIIDINLNSGESALTRSSQLQGYSFLIDCIHKNIQNGMTRDKAISLAIDTCIKKNVLYEFLSEHHLEVAEMLNWEYDADVERRVLTESGIRKGRVEGRAEGRTEAADLIAQLIKQGVPLDEALERIRSDKQL
ncbi:MAG: Rpn family recombination-promoting nuclease/putative transposase [Oscillospiraceae bacterium]|nr:Rpn family recombination-promoting nuclease/putative transposase [Oscillospiraceae bacterium]